MAIDPLAAITNTVGLFMQQDATRRAADAAANNTIFNRAAAATNVAQQHGGTANMLDVNDQIQRLLQSSGDDLDALIDQIVRNQNDMVGASAVTRNTAARDSASERNMLARQLADQDIGVAREGTAKSEFAASGDRTDAYGNKLHYNPVTGSWETRLSGQQSDLARTHGDSEQARLDALNEAIAGFRYKRPPSEEALRSEWTGLLTDTNRANADERANIVGRQALRIGKGASIPQILKSSEDALGERLPQTLVDARTKALQELIARNTAHNQEYLPAIGQFSSAIQAPASLTALDNTRNDAVSKLISTLMGNSQIMSNATARAGDRVQGASDKGIEDILNTLQTTEKERLGTATTGNALRLSNENTNIQRMIDALSARGDIYKSGAERVGNAITGGVTAQNNANNTNVGAIAKQVPDTKLLANLAAALTLNEKGGGQYKKNAATTPGDVEDLFGAADAGQLMMGF